MRAGLIPAACLVLGVRFCAGRPSLAGHLSARVMGTWHTLSKTGSFPPAWGKQLPGANGLPFFSTLRRALLARGEEKVPISVDAWLEDDLRVRTQVT